MRKWLLLVLLLCWPAVSCAQLDTPYGTETMLLYPQMNTRQQAIFDAIYCAAVQGETLVALPEDTSYDEAIRVMEALLIDCPELCALNAQYGILYYMDAPDKAFSMELQYVMPTEHQQQLVEVARQVADGAYGDEFEREVYLHNWLCQHTLYDLEAPHAHNAWGALMEGRAVCDGYARAMALLLRLSGIQCGVVTGESVSSQDGHAWNMVKVDGAYTWLDATGNDQKDMISYFYFNITDEWLQRSYLPETDWPLPRCTDESVSWHAKTWRVVEKPGDMEKHIYNNFRNLVLEGTMFNLRFTQEADYLSMKNEAVQWAQRYNQQADAPVSSLFTVYSNDAQQCVIIALE